MPDQVEGEPAAAVTLFGENIDRARRFTENLARHGEERGLIGPLEVPRLWTRHILNSAIAAPYFHGRSVDVGSGAGLPGMVLAIARPDVEWTLIEPMERRTAWLSEQVEALELTNVTVERMRGEEWAGGRVFDVATARAVSALRTLLSFTAPLVRPQGRLVFLKGANVGAELEAAAKQVRKYGLEDVSIEVVGDGVLDEPTRVFLATVSR